MNKNKTLTVVRSIVFREDLIFEQVKKHSQDLAKLFEKIIKADINVTFITSDIHKLLVALSNVKVNEFKKLVLLSDFDDARHSKKKNLKKILREVLDSSGIEASETMVISNSKDDIPYASVLDMQFVLVSHKKVDNYKNVINVSNISL